MKMKTKNELVKNNQSQPPRKYVSWRALQQANVSPIFKKNDPLDKENYRPVSILPLLSKVYEKLLYNRQSDYAERLSKSA